MARPYENMVYRKEIKHEGQTWYINAKAWYDAGEFRVYRIEGNVTTPLLREALELEAAMCGLALSIPEALAK